MSKCRYPRGTVRGLCLYGAYRKCEPVTSSTVRRTDSANGSATKNTPTFPFMPTTSIRTNGCCGSDERPTRQCLQMYAINLHTYSILAWRERGVALVHFQVGHIKVARFGGSTHGRDKRAHLGRRCSLEVKTRERPAPSLKASTTPLLFLVCFSTLPRSSAPW